MNRCTRAFACGGRFGKPSKLMRRPFKCSVWTSLAEFFDARKGAGSRHRLTACGRLEVQRHAVDAVAQAGGGWAVGEDVAEMAAAVGAMHLRTDHAVALVDRLFDRAFERHGEAWPPGAAFEFQLGLEER